MHVILDGTKSLSTPKHFGFENANDLYASHYLLTKTIENANIRKSKNTENGEEKRIQNTTLHG